MTRRIEMTMLRSYPVEPRDLEPYITAARRMLDEGEDLETVWRYLRDNGCDIGESIDVTVKSTGMIRREAKWAVCHSATWSDVFPDIVRLHDSIEQALIQITEEEPDVVTYRSGLSAESSR